MASDMSDSLASSSGSDIGSISDYLCSTIALATRLFTDGDLCVSIEALFPNPLGFYGVEVLFGISFSFSFFTISSI